MWESRQRFPSLALFARRHVQAIEGYDYLWYCWRAISLSFKQHRPARMRAILLASATVATCLRLRDVRSTSHVLKPEDCLVFCSSTVCAPCTKSFRKNTCCLVCWCRSAFACLRLSARRALLPARQRNPRPFLTGPHRCQWLPPWQLLVIGPLSSWGSRPGVCTVQVRRRCARSACRFPRSARAGTASPSAVGSGSMRNAPDSLLSGSSSNAGERLLNMITSLGGW